MDVLRLVGIQVAGEERIVISFSVEICVGKCMFFFFLVLVDKTD